MFLTIQILWIRNHCVILKAIDWVGNVSMMSTTSPGLERYHIWEGIFSQKYHAQEVPKCTQMHTLSQNPHPCYMGEEKYYGWQFLKHENFLNLLNFLAFRCPWLCVTPSLLLHVCLMPSIIGCLFSSDSTVHSQCDRYESMN